MTGKRLGALVVAAALIALAFVVRGWVDDDETTNPSDPTAVATTAPEAAGARAVVCIPELRAACDAIAAADPDRAVTVEPAFDTVATLAALEPGAPVPVWLTVDPFPGIVDAQRRTAGLEPLAWTATAMASTPLVVVARDQARLDVLAATCPDVDLWRCLGDHAGEAWTELGGEAGWREVAPSLGDPTTSATALVTLRAAVVGYFGTPDVVASTWELDAGFTPWVRALVRTVPVRDLTGQDRSPAATMARRPLLDLAASTDAELAALGGPVAGFATQYPASAMSLDAVVAAPEGAEIDPDVAIASDALTSAGWTSPPATPTAAPSATATLALLALWEEA